MLTKLASTKKVITKVTLWEAMCDGCGKKKIYKQMPPVMGDKFLCQKCRSDLEILAREIAVSRFMNATVVEVSPTCDDDLNSITLETADGFYLITGGYGGDLCVTLMKSK